MRNKYNFLFSLIFLLSACSMLQKKNNYFISDKLQTISEKSIAVLPFDNESTDLDAEKFVREEVIKELIKKGYFPIEIKTIDEKLKEIGIFDGGQLNAYKSNEISQKLNTRLLCYGYIENYVFQNLGFIVRKNVKLKLKIVDGLGDIVLYEAEASGDDSEIYLSKKEAQNAFLINTGVKLVSNISKKNYLLKKAVEKAVKNTLKKL